MRNRPKVGEILLRAGLVDQFQLNAALGEQKRWGSRLGATLVKLGFVEERDLVRALAGQLNLPVATLDGKRIHPDVLALVPVAVAEKHMVMPLFVKREAGVSTLYLGTDDPGNFEIFDDLAFRTGLEVKPVMVAPSEICEGIDRYYHRPAREGAPPRELDLDAESTAPVMPAQRVERSSVASGTEALVQHWTRPEEEDQTVPDHAQAQASAAAAVPPARATAPLPDSAPPEASTPRPVPAPPVAVAAQPSSAAPAARAAEPQGTVGRAPAPAFFEPPAVTTRGPASAFEAKTRVLVQALAQLLVEKGVMTREEFHQRVRDIQLAADDPPLG
jgi:type IV pilus assembly protein PilB